MVQHTLGKYQITKEKKKTKVQLSAEMSDMFGFTGEDFKARDAAKRSWISFPQICQV